MAVDARPLASALRERSDADLERLFTARQVNPRIGWRDFFDAAEALLDPTSIRVGLAALSRSAAAALAGAGSGPVTAEVETLRDGAFLDEDATAFRQVRSLVKELPAVTAADPAPDDPVDSAPAAERAFTTVGAVADLLLLSYTRPLQQIGTGALGAVERRRVVEAGIVTDPDDVDELLDIAATAGLMRTVDREWLVDPTAERWLAASTADRWRTLADCHTRVLPDPLAGQTASAWQDARPWDPQWPRAARSWRRRAELLGLIDAAGVRTVWAAGDIGAFIAHLPHEVDRVYLQNDLSAIAPGPLAPAADLRLRSAAVRESHAQASTYRFTETSVQNAIARGETEESLLAFLTELSLTGVPQPLAYLIRASARRHGEITVGVDPETGRTTVAATEAVRERLVVDQSLRSLGLIRDGEVLSSRIDRDALALALADARYPVGLVDATGRPQPLLRGRLAPPHDEPEAPYRELIARLRGAGDDDQDAAWLERELDAAVRNRAILEVTVTLPDGERTLTMEAAGLGGGRLRGRDRAADVERTLPLSHITAVRVVG